jgi:glycosyltransferase involved in cell wall biosynthesis
MNTNDKKNICLFSVKGTGHNLVYLKILIDALLVKEHNITVAIPKDCLQSESFNMHIKSIKHRITIITHPGTNSSNIVINSWQECQTLKFTLNNMVNKPEIVLVPNGTQIPFLWPFFKLINYFLIKQVKNFKFGMLSVGIDFSTQSFKVKLLNKLREILLSLNPKDSLNTIDACGYELLSKRAKHLQSKFSLVPDPMDSIAIMNKLDAKKYFNLPNTAFVISISGALNSHPRKNTKLLIDALSSAVLNKNIVLLMAGKLSDDLQSYVSASPADKEGRIFTVNRYLTDKELTIATCASELVCTPYSEHYSPSGIILRAIKCNVPVLVPNYHWFQFMVENFNIGWTIPVLTQRSLAESIEQAFQKSSQVYTLPAANELLPKYFSEENFSAHWFQTFDQEQGTILSIKELQAKYKHMISRQSI